MSDLDDLHRRVAEANSLAEQAIADYQAADAVLKRRARGDAGSYHVLKRDDLDLAGLASRASFSVANAQRLAAYLQIEMLGQLLDLAATRAERQRP